MCAAKLLTFLSFLCFQKVSSEFLPILIWHGLLADPKTDSLFIKDWIRNETSADIYIKSVDLTINELHEQAASVFVHPLKQIDQVCLEVMQDEKLKGGFNAIGMSQGGQFMRGLIQRCPQANAFNFISLAGQHQGIYGIPKCPNTDYSCELFRQFLNLFAYTDWAQNNIAQATYWHDPIREKLYRARSTFIADINNEKTINKDYIYRLHRLNRFVMVKFLRDEMVQPPESQWFGFYAPGSYRKIQKLMKSEIYSSDKLGLRQMMEDGKLFFLQVDDGHLKISHEWFTREIIPLLKEGEK